MSRAYRLVVITRGIPGRDLARIMTARFQWAEVARGESGGAVYFNGEGFLSGDQSEEEAHHQITEAIRVEYPRALVATRWTCIDQLPSTGYGDNLDKAIGLPHLEKLKGGASENG